MNRVKTSLGMVNSQNRKNYDCGIYLKLLDITKFLELEKQNISRLKRRRISKILQHRISDCLLFKNRRVYGIKLLGEVKF